MKPYLQDYRVINPQSEAELKQALDTEENAIPLAGCTDLFVALKNNNLPPTVLINMYSCPELQGEPELNDELVLKPLTTFSDVRYNQPVVERYPLLYQAIKTLSVLALQSRATWAGNIVNASPSANGVVALLVYDARLQLSSVDGERQVDLVDFYQDYKQFDLKPNEFLRRIYLPHPGEGWREYYRDVGPREYQAISKTIMAGRIKLDPAEKIQDVRLAAGSVYPYPLRLRKTEAVLLEKKLDDSLVEQACEQLQEEIAPIDDLRSNRRYRRDVTVNMLREFLRESRPL